MKGQFICKLTPLSEAWLEDVQKEETKPILQEHAAHLKRLADEGILVFDGHCLDAAFGVFVLVTEDEASVKEILNDDPFIKNELMSYEIHPFVVTISKEI